MSIINDALKKTQNHLKRQEEQHLPPSTSGLEVSPKPPKGFLPIILVGSGITIVLFSLLLFFSHRSSHTSVPLMAPKKASPTPNIPSRKMETPRTLTLEGIFMDNVKPLALINGKVVKVGDDIYGHEVIRISENSVEVQSANNVVTLSLP